MMPAAKHAHHALSLALALGAGGLGCALYSEGTASSPAGPSSAVGSTGAGADGGGASQGSGGSGGASSSSAGPSTGGAGAAGGRSGSSGGGREDCVGPDLQDAASGRCYRLFARSTEYENAPAACAGWHPSGTFAAVSTEAEYDFLAEAFAADTDFWIGADDLDEDGTWQWHNGETWGEPNGWGLPGAEPWKRGEPTGGAGELCLRMKQWAFESKNCDAQPFLCERP